MPKTPSTCANCRFFRRFDMGKAGLLSSGECKNETVHKLISYTEEISFDEHFGCIYFEQ